MSATGWEILRGSKRPVTGTRPDSMILLDPLNETDAPVVFETTVGPLIVRGVPRTLVPVYTPCESDSAILPTVPGGFEKSRLSTTETVHVEEKDEIFNEILVESALVIPGINAQLEIPGPSTETEISAAVTGTQHNRTKANNTGILVISTRDL